MLLPILALVGLLIAILLVVIATRPAAFAIERMEEINAPPATVFAQLEDLRAWQAWSPWEGLDPACQRTYGASSRGVGATYRWCGNRQVGEGLMTITDLRPAEHLGLTLQFFRPFAATNQVTFALTAIGTGTRVTWTMRGRNAFMGKAMSLVIDCDKMVGGQFATGLAQLKALCEKA